MANTVSLLSYANTFGDWVVTTNALVKENNNLAANNYIKSTGTLYLSDPTLGLQVANNAIVAGQLQVQGIGSSAYIQNNLRVDTQVYFQNTILGLTNSGQANINGLLIAQGPGTGLYVANTANIGGTLNVVGATSLGNTLSVTNATTLNNTLAVTGISTFTSNVTAQNYVNVSQDVNAINFNGTGTVNSYGLNVIGNGAVSGQFSVGGNFVINGSTVYNTNKFEINANSIVGLTSYYNVNRGVSANAQIRWNEANTYWDIRDVANPTSYSKILTANLITDSITTVNSNLLASTTAANTIFGYLTSNIAILQAQSNSNASLNQGINTSQNTAITIIQGVDSTQNTRLTVIEGTDVSQNTRITIIEGTNTTQNTNITMLNDAVAAANINASNSTYATQGTLPSGRLTGSYTGITGVGTISTGTWSGLFGAVTGANLTNLTAANLTGTIPSSVLGNSSLYVGTTAIPLNRGSASVSLTGVNIDGTAGSVAWTNVSGRPTTVSSFTNDSGYLISTGTINNAGYASTVGISYSNRSNANYQVLWGSSTSVYGSDLLFLNPSSGALYSYNNITAYYSDDRLKNRVTTIENALDKVGKLTGFLYTQNDLAASFGYDNTGLQVGVSAQEVQKVQPEAVKLAPFDVSDDGTSKSGENYLTVQYDKLVPLLIEAIKELKAEIDLLKK